MSDSLNTRTTLEVLEHHNKYVQAANLEGVKPFLLNFGSLWLVRIPLSAYLAPIAGLPGVWVAMCIELNVRGILLLLRLRTKGWSRRAIREE